MKEAVRGFLDHLAFERNASPHTVRAYAEDLAQFLAHARQELGREVPAHEVDHLLIRSFLARLHERGLKKTSSARRLAALRSFFRWLCREGVLDRNPARALLSPRTERHIPSHLEEVEVAALLDLPGEGLAAVRGRAILELLYATGLRCAELVGLDVPEVDLDSRMLRVLGKGRKERVVPFGTRAREAVSAWLQVRKGLLPRSEALFLNQNSGRLTDRSVRNSPLHADPPGCSDQEGQPPHPPAQLRDPPFGAWRRSPFYSRASGPRQPLDDPTLHPRQRPSILDIYRKTHPRA